MENKAAGVRKGSWTIEEDNLLRQCIHKYGEGKWHLVPVRAGLNRCRKSCRLRWLNYLRPNIKRGSFSKDEVDLIKRMHKLLGNRWSLIAGRLPGRTANDIKNFWNTYISKKPLPRGTKTITKSNIVRPSPQILLKLQEQGCPNVKQRASTLQKDENLIDKGEILNTTLPHVPEEQNKGDNERIQWWSSLLAMNEEEEELAHGVVPLSGEDENRKAPMFHPEPFSHGSVENDGNGRIGHLSLDDDDFWDL